MSTVVQHINFLTKETGQHILYEGGRFFYLDKENELLGVSKIYVAVLNEDGSIYHIGATGTDTLIVD